MLPWYVNPQTTKPPNSCSLGGLGIAKALEEGADIVICGRVSDASPIIGAAAWWHGWKADQFDELAGSLIIGHLLECAAYVSGGYSSDFKDLLKQGKHINLGFPICDINEKGEGVMYKEKNTGGWMTVNSVTSQLLYEIQGPQYYNCDVTAQLEGIKLEQVGEDRVQVSGVKGTPPYVSRFPSNCYYRILTSSQSTNNQSRTHSFRRFPSRIPCLPRWSRHLRKMPLDRRPNPLRIRSLIHLPLRPPPLHTKRYLHPRLQKPRHRHHRLPHLCPNKRTRITEYEESEWVF